MGCWGGWRDGDDRDFLVFMKGMFDDFVEFYLSPNTGFGSTSFPSRGQPFCA